MTELPRRADPYAPWRDRNFRRYEACWFGMVFSKHVETLAVMVYFVDIFDWEDAALALGFLGLVQALPVILLAIAGGQLADRFNRRWVLMAALGVRVLTSLGLAANAVWGGGSMAWIYALLGLSAAAVALGSASRSAMLPQLVPRAIFSNAIAWNSTVFYISSVVGPAAGGWLMALWTNPAPVFLIVAACRVFSIAALALVRYRPEEIDRGEMSWASVVAGVRFVWRTKLILATITLDLFAVLLGGAVYLLPIYAKDILQVGPSGLGLLRSAEAVGAMCMAVLLVHLPPMRRAGVALLWAVAGYGIAWIIFGLSTWFWLSLLMIFVVGALDNISVVVRHTLVQMLTPDAMRGRVSAVNSVFIVASNDLGGLESGLTARLLGPVASIVVGGIGTILVVVAVVRRWPQILSLGSLGAIQPVEAEDPPRV